jgi:hypothetical protein
MHINLVETPILLVGRFTVPEAWHPMVEASPGLWPRRPVVTETVSGNPATDPGEIFTLLIKQVKTYYL